MTGVEVDHIAHFFAVSVNDPVVPIKRKRVAQQAEKVCLWGHIMGIIG